MFREHVEREFAPYGTLSSNQLDALTSHYEILMKWNRRLNLTRIRSEEEAVQLHYCESLYLGRVLPAGRLRIADIGSGTGFPGIPLAIIRPECAVTLIESHQRKAVFLVEATRQLSNVTVLAKRAEDVDLTFDWCVSRAVALQEVVRLTLAPRQAVLMGSGECSGVHEPLPWGQGRWCCIVSRGT